MSDTTANDASARAEAPAATGKPWLTLFAAVLGGIMVGLDGTATTIAAPDIARSVGATLGELELIANAYLIALAVALLPAGRLADRIGRRRTFLLGVFGFALASLAVALSATVAALVTFRVLQGLAGALLQPAALALVRSAFPADRLGVPLGVWGGANALAIGLGPVVGGVLVHGFGWPAVFLVNLPLAVIVIAMTLLAVAESKGDASAGLGALRALLGQRAVYLGSTMVGASMFGVFGLLFVLTLYLQNVKGLDPITAGAWMLPPTCVVMVSAPIGGLLAQRFGPRWPVAAGLACSAGGLFVMSTLTRHSGFVDVLYPGVLVGFGTGLCVIAATEAIMGATPEESTGSASALQQIASQLGGVFGIVTVGSVLSVWVRETLPERIAAAGLGERAGDALLGGVSSVAQGLAPSGAVAEGTAGAVREVSQLSFVDAMGTALLVAAAVSVVGAVVALFLPPRVRPAVDMVEPSGSATR